MTETLDSLRREPDTELIVVDDGSTDPNTLRKRGANAANSVAVIRRGERRPLHRLNSGQALRRRLLGT